LALKEEPPTLRSSATLEVELVNGAIEVPVRDVMPVGAGPARTTVEVEGGGGGRTGQNGAKQDQREEVSSRVRRANAVKSGWAPGTLKRVAHFLSATTTANKAQQSERAHRERGRLGDVYRKLIDRVDVPIVWESVRVDGEPEVLRIDGRTER